MTLDLFIGKLVAMSPKAGRASFGSGKGFCGYERAGSLLSCGNYGCGIFEWPL